MTAHEIPGDQRLPFQHERELARRLAPVHFEHAQTGYGLVPIAEPVLAQKGEASAFGPRSAQRGAKLLRKVLRATGVVGVGDDDERRAAQCFEVCAIVFTHWQRVDEDVAARLDPRHAAKVDVAALVEARPTEEIGTVQEFHGVCGTLDNAGEEDEMVRAAPPAVGEIGTTSNGRNFLASLVVMKQFGGPFLVGRSQRACCLCEVVRGEK